MFISFFHYTFTETMLSTLKYAGPSTNVNWKWQTFSEKEKEGDGNGRALKASET